MRLSLVNFSFVCLLGVFVGVGVIFLVVTCDQGPAPEAHSIVRCSDTHGSVDYGAVCEYACEEGYHISDPSQNAVLCTAAGTWSRPPAVCERSAVQCSPPVAPESGQINCQPPLSVTASPSSYPQGSACNFTCNEGYEHQGPLTTECTQSGQWSSPPPTCTGNDADGLTLNFPLIIFLLFYVGLIYLNVPKSSFCFLNCIA